MSAEEMIAVVAEYRRAYNAKELDLLGRTLAADIALRHHNREVELHGRGANLEVMRQFGEIAPDRHLLPIRRQIVSGENVVVEHGWEGTLTADIPGFGGAGETVVLELCTVFTIRDGEIVEYDDYG